MATITKNISVYPKQQAFLESPALMRAFVGGIGSGKSWIGALDLIKRAKPGRLYLVTAPCYDNCTEILTEARGWQLFENLLPEDRVATLQEGKKLMFLPPKERYAFQYSGEMIDLENQEICLSVTPNHRCYVRFKDHSAGYPWQIKTASGLYGKWDWHFKKTAEWITGPPLTEEQRLYWEFLGFWFAEGCAETGNRNRVVITQKKYVEYAETLISTLARVYYPNTGRYSKDQRKDGGYNFTVYHRDAAREFVRYGNSHTKKLPIWIKNGNVEQLRAFLKGYIAGDGHEKKETRDQTQMWTKSKALADDLSEIAFKSGYAVCQAEHNRGMNYVCIRTKKKNEPSTAPKHWSKRHYDGIVYCVEVPGGLVYVRKNGKPCWCGNTYPMLSDATFRSVEGLARQLGIVGDGDVKPSPPPAIRLKTGAEILFRSTDNPETLRGPNLSGVWMDEASLSHQSAFDILIGRLREGGEMGWLSATFTPKGRSHWTFKTFATGQPDTELIHAETGENPFLPKVFASKIRARYTLQQSRQELGGHFLEGAGNHYFPDRWPRYIDTGDAYRIADGVSVEGGEKSLPNSPIPTSSEPSPLLSVRTRSRHVRKAECSRIVALDWAMGKPKSDAKSRVARATIGDQLTGDCTAFVVADMEDSTGLLFLLYCINERIPMGSNAYRLAELCRRFRPAVVASDDDNLSEAMILETARHRDIPTTKTLPIQSRNKLVRSQASIVRAERGLILLPDESTAAYRASQFPSGESWCEVLSNQLESFTGADGEPDDIADCLSILGRLADEFRPDPAGDDHLPLLGASGYDNCIYVW